MDWVSMMIIGPFSEREEYDEAVYVTEIFSIGEHFRVLARKNKK